MPYELPEDPRAERRGAAWRWASFGFAALLVAMLTYLGYVGFVGSGQVAEPASPSRDCRTPATAFGWEYEVINYEPASDLEQAELTDLTDCPTPGSPAGDELLAADGTRLAGWYIPAASGAGPTAPTIVLAHGHGTNKSAMLGHAQILHDEYNLVLFDFRNHGQSEDASTTVGLLERGDVRAVVDWLEERKSPSAIGLLGVSMGGAAAINAARLDNRVSAVVLDSTHATLANALQARLERAGYPLGLPAAWSILLGGLIRTGQDMSAADPVQAVERYGERPLLIIAAGRDDTIPAREGQHLLDAAEAGGADVQLRICDEAQHGAAVRACARDYRDWVLGFFARALGA